MKEFKLDYIKGFQFNTKFGDFDLICDQPEDNGGNGEYPTPVPFFVASIAMCAATYAGFFYKKNKIDMKGFDIKGEYDVEYVKNARIKSIKLYIKSPGIDEKNRKRYEAFVNQCLIVNTVKECLDIEKVFVY